MSGIAREWRGLDVPGHTSVFCGIDELLKARHGWQEEPHPGIVRGRRSDLRALIKRAEQGALKPQESKWSRQKLTAPFVWELKWQFDGTRAKKGKKGARPRLPTAGQIECRIYYAEPDAVDFTVVLYAHKKSTVGTQKSINDAQSRHMKTAANWLQQYATMAPPRGAVSRLLDVAPLK